MSLSPHVYGMMQLIALKYQSVGQKEGPHRFVLIKLTNYKMQGKLIHVGL